MPTSCSDIKSHIADAPDGTYTLYLGGDAGKPWQAFCAGMAGTPREYLSLTGANFAQYTHGGKSPGTDVRTTYTKVRFDPATQKVDITDRTFATSTGMLNHTGSGTIVTSMPYGVAMDCVGNASKSGVAQIDLGATAFDLAPNQFFAGGALPGSNLQIGSKRATLNGGGDCGWFGPTNNLFNPINGNVNPSTILQLRYAP
jgi:hypothetical protein